MSRGDIQRLSDKALRGCAVATLLALLAACAGTAEINTAANDPKKNGDGIGGTGIRTAEMSTRGDGIGGTGIVGTISGFSSIIVNGLKLEFDNTTIVVNDGKPTSLEALRIGQVVQGTARTRNGKLHLEAIDIQHAVTGPIAAVDHTGETMTVLGQKVRLNLGGDKTAIDAFRSLNAGDVVSVSGLRQTDGTIIATRVDQHPNDGRILVRGIATAVTATSVRIGDLDIPLTAGVTVSPPKAGERVLAAGRIINGVFTPDIVAGGDLMPFDKTVKDVSLEAYAPKAAGAPGPLTIEGVSVSGAALPPGTAANDRIIITGEIAGPSAIAATGIANIRTMVTINEARGSVRPATMRPDTRRPERVAPPARPPIDRPQAVRPETPTTTRPTIERPQGGPMV
jgi:hypothetical protein